MDYVDYRIAIISALAIEQACAEGMLDETHKKLPKPPHDDNAYTYGRIDDHNVVLACLPDGEPGAVSAAIVAGRVRSSFPNLRFSLLVGIGGGAPDMETMKRNDIRLGDVVVGMPSATFGGVVQYDMGKTVPASSSSSTSQGSVENSQGSLFTRTGWLNSPPAELLGAVAALRAKHRRVSSEMPRYLTEMREKYPLMQSSCSHQGFQQDQLFEATYNHQETGYDCTKCDVSRMVIRPERQNQDPVVHYGTIASANQVMRQGATRDKIAAELNVLCFEMEAAGLMNNFPCLVIRGICDYADSHKNKQWQPCAAAVAAAYAKELLCEIPVEQDSKTGAPKPAASFSQSTSLVQSRGMIFSRRVLQPVKHYVDRPSLASRIRDQLVEGEEIQQRDNIIVVVHGLGGVGKSQLVLRYVETFRSEYSSCLWITANKQESVVNDFTQIYRLAFDKLHACRDELPQLQDLILAVKFWITQQQGRRLLVFDGADEIMDSTSELYFDLMAFVPDGHSIDIIITTRTSLVREIATFDALDVDKLEPEESVALFRNSAKMRISAPESEILPIVEELGHLALAITLAGHYVSRNARLGSDLKQYLPEYRKQRKKILERKPLDLIHQYGESVLTTWETSFEAVENRSKCAARFLNLLAFLDCNDIFVDLFNGPFDPAASLNSDSVVTQKHWRRLLSPNQNLELYEIEEIFEILEDYSLIQRIMPSERIADGLYSNSPAQERYQMHKLVHAWCYERQTAECQVAYGCAALQLIGDATKKSKRDLTTQLRLVSHVEKSIELLSTTQNLMESAARALSELLWPLSAFLNEQGRYSQNEELKRFHVRCCVSSVGMNDSSTLTARGNLACALADRGKTDEAAAVARSVLEAMRRIFGPNHPDTISSLQQVANILKLQGKDEVALPLQHQVLEHRESMFGRAHDATMTALNNLACTLNDRGDLKEAESMIRECLEFSRSKFGDEHVDTLTVMSNLAASLRSQGQYREAALLTDNVINIRKKILGEEHPDTLDALELRATLLGSAGFYHEAVGCQREVFERRCHLLGERHPQTLTALNNLSLALNHAGDFAEASSIAQKVVLIRQKDLDGEHPLYLKSLGNLAGSIARLDRFDEAEAMYRNILETRRRVLPGNHPEIATTLHDLASVLSEQGRLEEALELSKNAREQRQRVLGDKDPDTLATVLNQATYLMKLGRFEEAVSLQRTNLEITARVQGEDHPDTLRAEGNLACSLCALGELVEGARIQEGLLQRYISLRGEDFEDTLTATSNFAATLREQGNLERAADLERKVVQKRKEKLGSVHSSTLQAKHNLAYTISLQGNMVEAEAIQWEVVEGRHVALGRTHSATILATAHLTRFLTMQNKRAEARAILEQTLSESRKVLRDSDNGLLDLLKQYADILWTDGDLQDAEDLEREYLQGRIKAHGRQHEITLSSMHNFAVNLINHGRNLNEAEKILREVIEVRKQVFPSNEHALAMSVKVLAHLLSKLENFPESAQLLQEVIDLRSNVYGDNYDQLNDSMTALFGVLWKMQHYDDAKSMQRRHLQMTIDAFGSRDPSTVLAKNNLAVALLNRLNELDEAEELLVEALEVGRETLDPSNTDLHLVMLNLSTAWYRQGRHDETESLLRELLEPQLSHCVPGDEVAPNAMRLLGAVLHAKGEHAEAKEWERKSQLCDK